MSLHCLLCVCVCVCVCGFHIFIWCHWGGGLSLGSCVVAWLIVSEYLVQGLSVGRITARPPMVKGAWFLGSDILNECCDSCGHLGLGSGIFIVLIVSFEVLDEV